MKNTLNDKIESVINLAEKLGVGINKANAYIEGLLEMVPEKFQKDPAVYAVALVVSKHHYHMPRNRGISFAYNVAEATRRSKKGEELLDLSNELLKELISDMDKVTKLAVDIRELG